MALLIQLLMMCEMDKRDFEDLLYWGVLNDFEQTTKAERLLNIPENILIETEEIWMLNLYNFHDDQFEIQ
jgi:hypothetical protein